MRWLLRVDAFCLVCHTNDIGRDPTHHNPQMTNSNGQTTLGFNKMEVRLLLDALEGQPTISMTEEGQDARIKLIKRLARSEGRLVEPQSWNANPWEA